MIEQVRIRSLDDEVAVDVELVEQGRIELTLVRDDGSQAWTVVEVADLLTAIQVLRMNAKSESDSKPAEKHAEKPA